MAVMAWLFLRDRAAVRIERAEHGYVIQVSGPGEKQERHEFSSEEALLEYQTSLEERLLADGWVLQAYHERRTGADRRVDPREGEDRRRSMH